MNRARKIAQQAGPCTGTTCTSATTRPMKRRLHELHVTASDSSEAHCSTNADSAKAEQHKTCSKLKCSFKRGKNPCTSASKHSKCRKRDTEACSKQTNVQAKHADSDETICKMKTNFHEKNHSRGSCCTERHHTERKKPCRDKCRKSKRKSSESNYEQTRGESVNADDDDTESDIPGFYYDKNTKRYYKILAGHKGVNIVTKKQITIKKREEQRISDLSRLSSSGKCIAGAAEKSGVKVPVTRRPITDNFLTSLLKTAQGDVSDYRLKCQFIRTEVGRLKPKSSIPIFPHPFGIYERVEHMMQMEVSKNNDEILGLWPVKETMVQRIQMLRLQNSTKTCDPDTTIDSLDLSIDLSGTIVLQSLNKITHLCWAPMHNNASAKYILYTTMCYTGYSPSLARLRNLHSHESASDFSSSRCPIQHTDFRLDKRATWTCAWDATKAQFSVGTEKCSLLVDAQTRRLWELSSNNSDVYAQIFSQDGRSFYSGTKKGGILCHDLRSISTKPVITLSLSSPVACLRFLENDTQLISSCVSGKICLWDMRLRHVVQTYPGQVNEYSRIPVHVDDTQTIIYGAGQDCYTRLWCLRTGRLLRSLPPPVACDIESIPAVRLSQQWGGQWGKRGLLMGLKDRLHFYSMEMESDIT